MPAALHSLLIASPHVPERAPSRSSLWLLIGHRIPNNLKASFSLPAGESLVEDPLALASFPLDKERVETIATRQIPTKAPGGPASYQTSHTTLPNLDTRRRPVRHYPNHNRPMIINPKARSRASRRRRSIHPGNRKSTTTHPSSTCTSTPLTPSTPTNLPNSSTPTNFSHAAHSFLSFLSYSSFCLFLSYYSRSQPHPSSHPLGTSNSYPLGSSLSSSSTPALVNSRYPGDVASSNLVNSGLSGVVAIP